MAIRLSGELTKLTFSGLKQPHNRENVLLNLLKFSIWGALGTGFVAGVSTLSDRGVIQRSAIAPDVFKANLVSCATFTLLAAFLIYRFMKLGSDDVREDNLKKLNVQTTTFARVLGLTVSLGSIATAQAGGDVREDNLKKFNVQTTTLTRVIGLTASLGSIATAQAARHLLKNPSTLKTLAEHLTVPLLCIGATGLAIRFFHRHQNKQLENNR